MEIMIYEKDKDVETAHRVVITETRIIHLEKEPEM